MTQPIIAIPITPIGKPRMTQRDKWAERPCVLRYRAFADELRLRIGSTNLRLPGGQIVFHLPMPASWPKKKRNQHNGQPHQQKPDIDNLLKAFLDALYQDDSHVWDVRATKLWSVDPRIEIVNGEMEGAA